MMTFHHRESPRVGPAENPSPEVAEILARTLADAGGTPLTVFQTMAHHPAMLKRFNVLAGFFLTKGTLPARDREIAVLRTAWRTGCRYEWGQHVLIGRDAGLTDTDIAAVTRPADSWTTSNDGDQWRHAALLRLVDDLLEHDDVSDSRWDAAAARYPLEQLLELVMLVGLYRMVAGFLNTTGARPESHLPGWPDA